MRYLNLWCTELPPVFDVSRGPINGAAPLGGVQAAADGESATHQDGIGHMPAEEAAGSNPAAAPPEPTPADSEGADISPTPSNEGPGTEREGEAWVPWEGGECPVPETTLLDVCLKSGNVYRALAVDYKWSCGKGWRVYAYRLANPTPRGGLFQLPADHPHAALERLWRSDDTLRCWKKIGTRWRKVVMTTPAWFAEYEYHVGHVPPKEES